MIERILVVAPHLGALTGYARTLDDGLRIVRTNEKGEREYMDDKQRAEEVRRTREGLASDCK